MATYQVSPGLNTLQAAINAANNTSGDILELADGTYTANTTYMISTKNAVTGTTFTNLTIRAVNPGMAVLDLSGCTGDAIQGNESSGVIIKDVVFSGNPADAVMRDQADSAYTGWVFDGITLRSLTKVPWELVGATTVIGTQFTLKNITTEATFGANYVVRIFGPATNIDLNIDGIDARLNDGTVITGVYLRDCRDCRIRGVKVDNPTDYGIMIESEVITKTWMDIYISDVVIESPGITGIHVGNIEWITGNNTTRVKLHNIVVKNAGHDGVGFDNFVTDCELIGFRIEGSVDYGIELEEETERITVSNGVIVGGVAGADGMNIVMGRNHIVTDNTISDVEKAFRIHYRASPGLPNGPDPAASEYVTPIERIMVRDNVLYDCDYIYMVETVGGTPGTGSMPAGAAANMLGPNTVYTPNIAFAIVDTVNKTQAEFEAIAGVIPSIDTSDTIIDVATAGSGPSANEFSVNHCLNILCGASSIHEFSDQAALNRLVGNTANPNHYSIQAAANLLLLP